MEQRWSLQEYQHNAINTKEREKHMALQITGIRKPDRDDPHEAISHYRWFDHADDTAGVDEREVLIKWMQDHEVDAYVEDDEGKVWCGIRENKYGTKYLQTYADKRWTDNLLSLPPC
jgi:hypothetical protein